LGLNGTLGALEFQFVPGNGRAPLSTAAITGFTSDGTVGTGEFGPQTSGYVAGVRPGSAFTSNDRGFADYFHPFTYVARADVGGGNRKIIPRSRIT
jgi:hypothetical protein